MNDLGNKIVLANNLNRLLQDNGKDRNQLCSDLSIKYSTLSDWLNAKKYPRIDKIEMLANYFGVEKSAIIEKPVLVTRTPIIDSRISTIAAHHEGDDWSEEEAEEIERFVQYVLSKREK